MNALVNTGGRGLAAFSGNSNPFTKAADDAGVSSGQRLQFNGKHGGWSLGKEAIDDGTVLAFDLWNAKYVWTAWKGGKPVDTHFYSIVDGEAPPAEDAMPNHWVDGKGKKDGWNLGIMVKCVDPNVGDEMETTLKADNPWRPILKLLKEYGNKLKMQMGADGVYNIPLITIGTEQFPTRDGDVAFAPVLDLTDWITVAEMDQIKEAAAAAAAGDEVEEADAAPAPAPAPKPAPTPASGPKPALRIGKRA